jgi:Flp pilus assembly protein TadB
MDEPRRGWAYRRRSRAVSNDAGPVEAPAFRSDNDLHQWRYEWGWMAAVGSAMITAVQAWDVSLRFWPLLLVPVIGGFLLSRWQARCCRRRGKRFSHYEDDRLSR